MVFHALCEQFLPSHRGLARNHESLAAANDDQFWQEHRYHHYGPNISNNSNSGNAMRTNDPRSASQTATNYRRNNSSILDLDEPNRSQQEPSTIPHGVHNNNKKKAVTRQKRNHFKASKFLASLAADFDVVTDWLFYMHCNKANREYHRDNGGEYQIPPILVNLVLLSCIVGTILWLILATDGRIVLPLWRQLGYDKLSLGHVLGATVLLEDLPQVLLTFLIEDYFEEDQTFNNYALMNVVASVYDILIKLAEAFDQRADVVETGHWCKESIAAHDKRIVCLVPIPSSRHTDNYNREGHPTAGETFSSSRHDLLEEGRIGPFSPRIHSSTRNITTSERFRNQLHVSNSNLEQQYEQQQQHSNHNQRPQLHRKKSSRRRSILQEAQEIVADTRLPPMRFLSASKDATVKLWDTAFDQRIGRGKREPLRTFSGHEKRVSCVAFVKKVDDENVILESYSRNKMESKAYDQTTAAYYFLTGSYDGTSKLWSTNNVECLKTYSTLPLLTNNDRTEAMEITCLAYLPILRNEERMSRSATSTTFDDYFVNGYKSGKTRLWDLWSGSCLKVFDEANNMAPSGNNIFSRVYNHRKNRRFKIYSVCSMEDSRHFATGSVDGSIRLWDVGSMSPIHQESQATAIEPYVSINDIHDNSMGDTEGATNTTAILASTTRYTSSTEIFTTPKGLFVGHIQTVISIKCVSPGSVLLSGSLDGTAMLWSISTGACLQVFSGHTGPVHGVAVVDQVTILTASGDGTVKAWDALSGEAFRTYEGGHNSPVTAVTMGDQSGCFASGAEDGTVGLWIFSAVHDKHHRRMLGVDDDDDIGLFCGCEEDVVEDDDCHNNEVVDEEILNAQGYTRFHSQ